ncbi:MAG: hypothetical protein HKN14_11615 [Marinicaulis sp.]|nr:hypothetical protein [Marinicaulis sp.]NNE41550.1 hypothetical protein [Marinicaulis sp.]NNL88570.1 hypothetical protein [Marinicaulis sp.]
MILRRITEHVKAQNWFAVGLDFIIVVFGVFIGFQVTSWNEGRETGARAKIFSSRLLDDVRYEAWAYQYSIDYYKDVRVNAERAANALTGDKEMSDEQLLISAYRATQWVTTAPRRASYNELIATGEIGLIEDNFLRETAISVFNQTTTGSVNERARDSDFRKIFRQTVPIEIQHTLLTKCGDLAVEPGDYVSIVGSINYDCVLDLPINKIEAAAALLRAQPDFLPALQLRFADLETAIENLEKYNADMLQDLRDLAKVSP